MKIMKKNSRYLVKTKTDKVHEIKILDITKTCYKIVFIVEGDFGINFSKIIWLLKSDFEDKYVLLEELLLEELSEEYNITDLL